MSANNYFDRNFWIGTAAERAACIPLWGAYWIDTGTDELWGYWSGAWHLLTGGGGVSCFICDGDNTYGGDGAFDAHVAATHSTAIGHDALSAETNGSYNTAVGSLAMGVGNGSSYCVAVGYQALQDAHAIGNTAVGALALTHTTTGVYNVGISIEALHANLTGNKNVAIGMQALYKNTGGDSNIAIGSEALWSNLTSDYNIAIGDRALTLNTSRDNIAIGTSALENNTTADNNVAIGSEALYFSKTGRANVAIGGIAMFYNYDGRDNVAIGNEAMASHPSGVDNVAVGSNAIRYTTVGDRETGVGAWTLAGILLGDDNSAFGEEALTIMYATGLGIDSFSDYSGTVAGTVRVESPGHGLPGGVTTNIRIANSIHYDGVYSITQIDGDYFYFTHAWSGDDCITNSCYWTKALEGRENTGIGAYAGNMLEIGSQNTFLGYNAGGDALQDVDAINSMALGANAYTIKDNQVVVGDINITETVLRGEVIIPTLHHDGPNLGLYGTAPIVQDAGWAMSNVTPDKILDADATTLAELADVVGTLVDTLKAYGLIGA